MTTAPTGGPHDPTEVSPKATFDKQLGNVRRRLVQEATQAVHMLEEALDALWTLDKDAAGEVRRRDDRIDTEEVAIEQECFRLLALQHPFARDFRAITFILKVNADIERVADHAASIAKVAMRLRGERPPPWPTALTELGQRVPAICHRVLRAVLDEDAVVAKAIIAEDEVIDQLEKRVFEETLDFMRRDPADAGNGLLIYRLGRELERIGDLMKSIAEDIVYLKTGEIVRHEKRRRLATAGWEPKPMPPDGPPA